MFKELHPLIKQTRLLILVSAEGDLLRVNITPKSGEGENPALATPLSLLATPEELDADLPTLLTEYAGAHMDLRASLNSAVAQINEGKAGAGKKPDEAKPAKKSEAKKSASKAKPAPAEATETAAPSPEETPEVPVDEEPDEAETAAADPQQEEVSETAPAPTEAAPPADDEPAAEPAAEGHAAPEKDPNTIELF